MLELYTGVEWSQAGKAAFHVMRPKKVATVVGSILRKVRTEKRLTMQQVADLCGMKMLAVYRLETSPKANPQLATLQKLAGALGVTVAELVKDVPVIPPQDTAAVN